MARLKVLIFPDKGLKKKSKWLETVNPEIEKLALDMIETMYRAPGIGLAAPQIGVLKRLIVMDTRYSGDTDEEAREDLIPQTLPDVLNHESLKVFINPEVLTTSDELIEFEEGCLSVPDFTEVVKRPAKIKVTARLLTGESVEFEAEGLYAVCIQHEIDHLDGKLFIDRISSLKRNIIKKKIRKQNGTKPTVPNL